MRPTDIAFRRATDADVAAIERIVHGAYSKYVARMEAEPGPMRDDYAAKAAGGVVWLAEQGGETVGLIVLIPETDHLLIENVAVIPGLQGTGLGRRLFGLAHAQAARLGLEEIRLYTAEEMVENLAIYRHWGWTEYARAAQAGYARVFMRKRCPIADAPGVPVSDGGSGTDGSGAA